MSFSDTITTRKSTESFLNTSPDENKQQVVWIRHAALKEHDLMLPLEGGLVTLNDLRIEAQKKIGQVSDAEIIVKEIRRKNGELLDLRANLHESVKKSEILIAISDENAKAKKHIRIEHEELNKRKVELWLPLEDSKVKYDDFCGKVEDLLQVHLGESVKLQRMKSKKGGIVDNETALQAEVQKGAIIHAETIAKKKKTGCFCF